jgi:hypothetical protein
LGAPGRRFNCTLTGGERKGERSECWQQIIGERRIRERGGEGGREGGGEREPGREREREKKKGRQREGQRLKDEKEKTEKTGRTVIDVKAYLQTS